MPDIIPIDLANTEDARRQAEVMPERARDMLCGCSDQVCSMDARFTYRLSVVHLRNT
jgi:hypothetical protein